LVAMQPKSLQARVELARVFIAKGDDRAAVDAYREAVRLAPSEVTIGLQLGQALSQAGRTEEARTQYQAVLKAHPDDPKALNDMAYFVSQNGGDLDQAMTFAQRALEKAPSQPGFSDTMGCLYLKKGLNDSALQVFGNLVKKYPNYPTFRYHLGMALLERGDKKSAKKELQAALAAHPSRQDEARIKELLGKIG
jgi:Flp pilus assembly protein TadD